MNLFESFRNIVDQEFIEKIKPNLDDNLGDFDLAINGIYYTLVAGLIRRTNSDMSAGMLYNQIEEKYKKSSITHNFPDALFSKETFVKISNEGSKIISQIFPAYKSPLISMISTYAGTSKNNTVLFSGMTASILIDILGDRIKKDKMDKDDMVFYLKQHHEPLFKEAPENLMEKMIPALGLQELIHMKFNPNQKKSESKTQPAAVEVSSDYKHLDETDGENDAPLVSKKMLIGLISAAIIAAIGYYLYANRANLSIFNSSKEEPEELVVDENLLAPSADSLAKMKADSLTLSKSDSLASSADDITPFNTYLLSTEPEGKDFDFNSIKYKAGSFEITPESLPVIEKLAESLKVNDNTQIKIVAFANGDAKLANKRAFAVKRFLQEKGIKDLRIDAGPGGSGGDSPRIKVIKK